MERRWQLPLVLCKQALRGEDSLSLTTRSSQVGFLGLARVCSWGFVDLETANLRHDFILVWLLKLRVKRRISLSAPLRWRAEGR